MWFKTEYQSSLNENLLTKTFSNPVVNYFTLAIFFSQTWVYYVNEPKRGTWKKETKPLVKFQSKSRTEKAQSLSENKKYTVFDFWYLLITYPTPNATTNQRRLAREVVYTACWFVW